MPSPPNGRNAPWVDDAKYQAMYRRSLDDPNGFWAEHGKRVDWIKPYTRIKNTDYHSPVSIKWFEDGTLNVAANCVDRHLAKRGDQVAILWEPDDPATPVRRITYRELHAEVCRFANVLKKLGVKKGDRVTDLHADDPRGRFRHAGDGADRRRALGRLRRLLAGLTRRARINDCESKLVITADEGLRGGKKIR